MMKYVAPIFGQLRHLDARIPKRGKPTAVSTESETFGQRLAEHAAALIGSWRFLLVQACLLALWVLVNGLRITGFDPPPFILLNLLLSFQAGFTGPILLIAANVGAIKDHRQYDRMESLERREEDMEENILARLDKINRRLDEALSYVRDPPLPAPVDPPAPPPAPVKRSHHKKVVTI
jgi:uncharacterized membrane protein